MDPVEDDENNHALYMRGAMENDETHSVMDDMPTSLSTYIVSDELSSTLELQISSSLPPAQLDFRWNKEVLVAFEELPDFTPEQVEDLPQIGFSPGSQLVCVGDYLEAFRGMPENQDNLRILTEKLKKMGRADVVKAMHLQRGALRRLGPVLPEERSISDIAPSLWVPLTAALSAPHPQGFNWKWLAKKVDISRPYIDLWQQKKNPAGEVLTSWMVRKEATIGRLFDLLLEHREDLAAML